MPASAKGTVISIAVAAAALGAVVVMLNSVDTTFEVRTIPAEPTAVSPVAPAQALPPPLPAPQASPVSQPPTPAPQASLTPQAGQAPQLPALATDSRGYVDSARCDETEKAAAIARTARAVMVVCEKSDGTYEYRGVRLRDGASLTLDDVRPLAAGYEVRNENTTYRLSPTELVVMSGETLQSRDAMVEYRTG